MNREEFNKKNAKLIFSEKTKDIAIGFGNYLGENYEYKIKINDEAFFYCIEDEECYYTSQIFDKYLNTLK